MLLQMENDLVVFLFFIYGIVATLFFFLLAERWRKSLIVLCFFYYSSLNKSRLNFKSHLKVNKKKSLLNKNL